MSTILGVFGRMTAMGFAALLLVCGFLFYGIPGGFAALMLILLALIAYGLLS